MVCHRSGMCRSQLRQTGSCCNYDLIGSNAYVSVNKDGGQPPAHTCQVQHLCRKYAVKYPFMQCVVPVKSASICERLASTCCMQIGNLSECKQQELNKKRLQFCNMLIQRTLKPGQFFGINHGAPGSLSHSAPALPFSVSQLPGSQLFLQGLASGAHSGLSLINCLSHSSANSHSLCFGLTNQITTFLQPTMVKSEVNM